MRRYRYIPALPLLAILIFSSPVAGVSTNSEEKTCPAHHIPLKKEKLEIIYGLVSLPCDSWDRAKAAEEYFPYANSAIYGGCLIFPDSPKYQDVLYCQKCREVERSWHCLETRDTPIITALPKP